MNSLTRILVASDLHGSNACFRKLLGLTRDLRPDAVVIAGDFSGKHTNLITRREEGWLWREKGRWFPVPSIDAQVRQWASVGQYWTIVDETQGMDQETFDHGALQARITRLQKWMEAADSEFSTLSIPCYVIPGNDDSEEVACLLASGSWVRSLDERVEMLFEFELAGLGYSNPTPWRTWRELSEDEILTRLRSLPVRNPEQAILVIHVPPHGSGLDVAPALAQTADGTLEMIKGAFVNVGSSAVSTFLSECQPNLVISGHCHSSHGVRRLGRTSCVNPGSSYNTGTLNALLLVLEDHELAGFQFLVR